MSLSAFAPAKVNLFLHVGGPDADGYHPVASLMVFADVGDRVAVQPAENFEFGITGPFGHGLAPSEDNLVVRAARALLARVGGPKPPFRLVLDKQLPIAAGLGGGSSDAGATLKLLRQALDLPVQDEILTDVAAELGADGPACLWARTAIAQGRGERLSPAPTFRSLDAVLVNPGVPSPTGAVYRAYDEAVAPEGADLPPLPERFESAEEAAAFLAYCRNDLEAPAVRLEPRIGEALDLIRGEPETLLGRMSGSGATCFALCAGDIEAEGLAERLQVMRPDWWVRRCRLG
ncbi:4-(cytidine 5'-diphospho)-2-C-methyl-D-erythritol kinase [Caulobacter mirabilis]|uniref:4-diphosphocytidyl-2-C-methyl-D-erythritol kinase n=1 Tax=Caulobacter mirabilis TaxID=69666 RepID=A0A2D2AZQ6_9CAUL|nr:4-(cytidine 5'-diphospho)-2-C-methyl-D-erythritol kinase [Caulobacter mirabilis]ATQ43482.1 4-(cytidine 5'-diphospho)-2-C-methyl-D-erythritol kinase [Caulobacter mirabilis]